MKIYPTKKDLIKVKSLGGVLFEKPQTILELKKFIDFLHELWYYPDRIIYEEENGKFKLYLSTGGWSGNESVIDAIDNTMFWFLFWQKSERGGHFWFEGKIENAKYKKTTDEPTNKAREEE